MQTPVTNPYAALDAYVERELRRLKVPGAALAVVTLAGGEGDEMVHYRGFGQAEPFGPPPTPQTPFCIGSVTKSFTALAVMQLAEAGRLDLDAPVQRYLPWFRVADPAASSAITVRHLLNQTSGFSLGLGCAALGDLDDGPDAAERQGRELAAFRPTRPPGAAFDYSNPNYSVLGLIVEAVSGETYADYVRNCIFNPLNMTHSYATRAEAQGDDLAAGHRFWFWRPVAEQGRMTGAGQLAAGMLISSAEDLAHYVSAHLNGGRYDGAQILSPAGIAEMHRGAVEVVQMGVSVGQYGMGWFVSDLPGILSGVAPGILSEVAPGILSEVEGSAQRSRRMQVVWHSGLVPDYTAFVALLPSEQKGLILLLNTGHFWMEPLMNEFGLGAAAALAGAQPGASPMPWLRHAPAIMQALMLIPLVYAVGSALVIRRWWTHGAPAGLRMVPYVAPDLALMAAPVALAASPLNKFLALYAPDVTWLARIWGALAAAASAAGFLIAWLRKRRGGASRHA